MVEKLIVRSARNPFLIGLATLALIAGGLLAILRTPLDALPDLSDVQVIVYTEVPGQAPQVVEDQVTYPLTTAMLSVPHSKVVRGFSFFGVSFVYVIFEDGTDVYWARSRVLEYLNTAQQRLPRGVVPNLGPDATGVGWVYQYALMSGNHDLAELRSMLDWQARFAVAKAQGVAEVASVGGFVKQYAIVVEPHRMRALGVTLEQIRDAVRAGNMDIGGRTVELPVNGWLAYNASRGFYEFSAINGGRRIDYVKAPDYEFLDGRGAWTELGSLGALVEHEHSLVRELGDVVDAVGRAGAGVPAADALKTVMALRIRRDHLVAPNAHRPGHLDQSGGLADVGIVVGRQEALAGQVEAHDDDVLAVRGAAGIGDLRRRGADEARVLLLELLLGRIGEEPHALVGMDGQSDQHLLPFHGTIAWGPLMEALREIGYEGDFTFEAHNSIRILPDDLRDAALALALRIGEYLLRLQQGQPPARVGKIAG